MNQKVLIFSHRSDNDGITPVILAKLAFQEVEYILEEPSTIDESFEKNYHEGKFDQFDAIYVTDLCINDALAQIIQEDENNKNKILVFDHHHSQLDKNKYPFVTVIDEQNGKKECGSSLFYQYLLTNFSNELLQKAVVREMVELVRLLDTWEWKKENNLDAKYIGNLFNIYGREYYLNYYYQYCLNKEHIHYSKPQKHLLEVEELRIQNYITKKEKEIIPIQIQNYHIALLFAETYRSELGNALAEKYHDTYDFIILINVSRSITYRGIDKVDLGEFAKIYGGGGHFNAAGSPLPKGLQASIIHHIFKDATILENEEEK